MNKIGGNSFSYVPLIIICEMQKYTKPFSVKINPKLFPKRPSEYLPDAVRLHSLVAFSCWVISLPCALRAASDASCMPWPTNLALTRVCYCRLGTGGVRIFCVHCICGAVLQISCQRSFDPLDNQNLKYSRVTCRLYLARAIRHINALRARDIAR